MTLNGKTAATFMLDTGSQISVISATLAKKMGLLPQPSIRPDGRPVIVGGEPLNAVTVASLGIGEGRVKLAFTDCPLAVFADKSITGVSDIGIDGIVGTDLLRLMAVDLDGSHHQITFWYPGNLSPQELTSAGFDHSFVVPVTDSDKMDLYYVQGQFQNGSATALEKMMIDTGINATTISPKLAASLKLVSEVTGKANLFASTATVFRATVPVIHFGDLTLHNYPVCYYEKDNSANPISLGMDVLSGYRVLLDYAHGAVYLKSAVSYHINILSK